MKKRKFDLKTMGLLAVSVLICAVLIGLVTLLLTALINLIFDSVSYTTVLIWVLGICFLIEFIKIFIDEIKFFASKQFGIDNNLRLSYKAILLNQREHNVCPA